MNMKSITLKQLRLVSGAIASLGVCLGLYSAVKADDLNIKSFSLLAATSSVIAGMASYGALILGEDVANKQINDIIADQKKAVDTAKRLKGRQ